jgi:hypothetical protein
MFSWASVNSLEVWWVTAGVNYLCMIEPIRFCKSALLSFLLQNVFWAICFSPYSFISVLDYNRGLHLEVANTDTKAKLVARFLQKLLYVMIFHSLVCLKWRPRGELCEENKCLHILNVNFWRCLLAHF